MAKPTEIRPLPLSQAVDLYLDDCRRKIVNDELRPTTVENYATDLRQFLALVPHCETTEDVTGTDVDAAITAYGEIGDRRRKDYKEGVKGSRNPGSVLRLRRSVSRFFAYARTRGWVTLDPMASSEAKPKVRGGLRTARTSLTSLQAGALLEHGAGTPETNENYLRDQLMFTILAVTGLRVSELVGANTDDIRQGHHGTVLRVLGKGNHERIMPLPGWLAEAVYAYRASRTDDCPALVVTRRGKRMAARDVQRALDAAVVRTRAVDPVNAREVTPHGLRHTAATLMLAEGWDVKIVQRLLGHSSVAITSRYLDALSGELEAAMESHPLGKPQKRRQQQPQEPRGPEKAPDEDENG